MRTNSTYRAREIQAQEGLSAHQVWGPPTSGNSTPLRETIPESPNAEGFPDFTQSIPDQTKTATAATARGRTRAGTLPSRFSPAAGLGALNPQSVLVSKTSRPTPSTSPFKPGSATPGTPGSVPGFGGSDLSKASLLSRLRAGSMPQRPGFMPSTSPFGLPIFSTSYASSRDRSNTLASIRSGDGPLSPALSHFSRDSIADNDVKTLDYLGLVDTPKPSNALLNGDYSSLAAGHPPPGLQPAAIAELAALTKNANRFRSYSVNAKEKYADEDDELGYGGYSGAMTPGGDAAAYAAIQEAVRQHNLEVQAFANYTSMSRPRARTAGVLETPSTHMLRNYLPTPTSMNKSMNIAELAEEAEYSGLAEAVESLKLGGGLLPTGDEHNIDSPTRALWLGNIPSSTTVSSLNVIFSNFGPIESTRVLTHKNCGFVNFENIESAVTARTQLNGKEIFPGAGPVRIGYAKVPSATGTPGNNGIFPSPSPDPQIKAQGQGSPQSTHAGANRVSSAPDSAAFATPELSEIRVDIAQIVKDLGATDDEQIRIAQAVEYSIANSQYAVEIPLVPDPSHTRVYDAPRLREIRKRIDNNTMSPGEVEEVAMSMLPEIAELASDYLGNTVVQKLFEYCSEPTKEAMLAEITPHLAAIGVHKNGTWAAQKIIDVARTPATIAMVVQALRPYSMLLFLDQFGNYVMQGCLRYGFPMNNFIFEVMLARLWELAQGRFGARAMRACLESHHSTKDQQRMIAAAITLHSVQLATNANGALLLTWFLDTCTFPRRRTVLAPRLVPHLVQLCTHKVAYLTVLKIINQRNEPEARDMILNALFFSANDQILEEILQDQACGATLIFKVLTTPFFDENIRNDVVNNVRKVLVKIKAQPQQGYKRLMDEVGLSTRAGGPRDMHHDRNHEHRPASKHGNANNHMQQNMYDAVQPTFSQMNMQRTPSMDSSTTYDSFMAPAPNMMAPGMNQQAAQYQQMLANAARQNQYYNSQMGTMNGGYSSPAPSMTTMDSFRNMQSTPMGAPGLSGSPLMPQAGFGQAGFNPMMNQQMYGQYQMGYMPAQQMQVGAGRRGRVGQDRQCRWNIRKLTEKQR
jgi:protein JSN1